MHPVLQVVLALLLTALAEPPSVTTLIEQLGSPSFQEREAASKKLEAQGVSALSALREARVSRDAEVSRRAKRVIESIQARFSAEESRKLQGNWRLVPVTEVKENLQVIFTFDAGCMYQTLRPPGDKASLLTRPLTWMMNLRWDSAANQIDFATTGLDSDGRRQFRHGIYELKGDRLRLYLDQSGDTRPEEFEAAPGSKRVMFVLKREQ